MDVVRAAPQGREPAVNTSQVTITDAERREFERMMEEGLKRNADVIGGTMQWISPGAYRNWVIREMTENIAELYELHSDALWERDIFSVGEAARK